MRELYTVIVVCLLFLSSSCYSYSAEEPKKKEAKFEVSYTITYNVMNLSEAAEMEKRINGEHSKSCKIQVQLKPISNVGEWVTITTPTMTTQGVIR